MAPKFSRLALALGCAVALHTTAARAQLHECEVVNAPPAQQQHAELVRTLRGSDDALQGIALSRDGSRLAVGSNDRTVRVWGIDDGVLRMQSRRLDGPLWQVEFTRNGERVVSYGPDGEVFRTYVWDISTGQEVGRSDGLGRVILADTAFSVEPLTPEAGRVGVFDVVRRQQLLEWSRIPYEFGDVYAATGAGPLALTWRQDGTARIITTNRELSLSPAPGHYSTTHEAAGISPNGGIAFYGSAAWDASSGRRLYQIPHDSTAGSIVGVHFTSDSGRVILAYSLKMDVHDARTGRRLATMCGVENGSPRPRMTEDGAYLIARATGGGVAVWQVASGAVVARVQAPPESLWAADISGDARRIATGSTDGSARIWSLEFGAGPPAVIPAGPADLPPADDPRALLDLEPERTLDTGLVLRSIAVAPDESAFVAVAEGGELSLWPDSGEAHRFLAVVNQELKLASGPAACRRWGAIQGTDVVFRDWSNGRVIQTLSGHEDGVVTVAMSRDCRTALTASLDGTVREWNLRTGRLVRVIAQHESEVASARYSRDGTAIVVADVDGQVSVYARNALLLRRTEAEEIAGLLDALPVDSENKVLIVGVSGLAVWDGGETAPEPVLYPAPRGATSEDLSAVAFVSAFPLFSSMPPRLFHFGAHMSRTLNSAGAQFTSIAASPRGDWIAAGAGDGTTRLWQSATGRLAAVLRGDGSAVPSLVFSSDGRRLHTASANGQIRTWSLPSP